ncbi:hypothetical protein ACWC9U_37865 [Streptomyces sp. 900116325]
MAASHQLCRAAVTDVCLASLTARSTCVPATPTAHQRMTARPTSGRPAGPMTQAVFPAPNNLSITVRDVGPLADPAGLRDIVIPFGKASHQAFTESVIEPDTRLNGLITAVRDRGQFRADALLAPARVSALRAGRRIISDLALLGKAVLGRRLLLVHELVRPPTTIAMINADASSAWH